MLTQGIRGKRANSEEPTSLFEKNWPHKCSQVAIVLGRYPFTFIDKLEGLNNLLYLKTDLTLDVNLFQGSV